MKSVKLTAASLLATVLLLGGITGCSQKAAQTEPPSSAVTVTSEAPSSQADSAEQTPAAERTITDMEGRTVTIPAQIEKNWYLWVCGCSQCFCGADGGRFQNL
uniref:hypothetical protein n=1 Tax=Clostridium sp. NkU-1 TaxID=1095009 RepID=UPI0006CF9B01